ncbi:M48 family metalloprotease [uncultured Jatrophihabitans sp.]|uniref:M48 family metalloprotease n=1 Tax=uncultured Jatrophihabitans sp. TaxID=1610747 RepID=UPI0035CA7EC0
MNARDDRRRAGLRRQRRRGYGVARLLVATPAMVGSLLLLVLCSWAGQWEALLLLAWLASAAAVFTPVGERAAVRWACGFVRPSARQRAQLEPAWRRVLGRCGVDPGDVDLYLQRSRAVNAFTAGGRSVALTTGAQAEFVKPHLVQHHEQPANTARVEALLAHELGHWAGNSTRVGLVTAWLAAPWRLVSRLFLALGLAFAHRQPRRLLALLVVAVVGVAVVQAIQHGQPTVAALLVGLAVGGVGCPLADAALSRRDEYAADRYAADAGYGADLAAALACLDGGSEHRRPGLLDRLTARHPSVAQRLDALYELELAGTQVPQSPAILAAAAAGPAVAVR